MTLNTAVVGGGAISPVHLSGLKAHPDVDLRAVCDADETVVGDRAAEYDLRAYGDFEGMLALESLDWIHLCTPVGTHVELARMALEDDLAIQIESPLADRATLAEELSTLVTDRDARVSVVHEGAFDPAIVEATGLLREGAIGGLRAIDLLYAGEPTPDAVGGREWLADLPGGVFEERLVRPVSQLLRLGGYPNSVDSIGANATCQRSYGGAYAYDCATFQYTTADGVHCSGTVVSGDERRRVVRVHGDRGRLVIDLLEGTVTRRTPNRDHSLVTGAVTAANSAVARLRDAASRIADAARGTPPDGSSSSAEWDGRLSQIHREANALASGDPLPVPLSAGVWATRVVQAVRDDATSTIDRSVELTPKLDPA